MDGTTPVKLLLAAEKLQGTARDWGMHAHSQTPHKHQSQGSGRIDSQHRFLCARNNNTQRYLQLRSPREGARVWFLRGDGAGGLGAGGVIGGTL